MIECVNCGARINKEDVKCPYCGAMQYDAAEKQYMEKLYSLEEGMDRLDDDARESISKSMLKCALITLAAAAAAVFIGILSGYARYYQYYTSYGDFLNAKESMDWYDNNIDSIEECYSRREFAAIRDKLNSGESVISHRALKNWEHYPLCVAYSDTYYEFERTKPSDNGNYKGYEFTVKYRAAIYTIRLRAKFMPNVQRPIRKLCVSGLMRQRNSLRRRQVLTKPDMRLISQIYTPKTTAIRIMPKYRNTLRNITRHMPGI